MKTMVRKVVMAGAAVLLSGSTMAAEKPRIFFVGAHPDDTEGFAATAFLLAEKYELHVIDLTRGELGLGYAGLWDGSTGRRRVAEEQSACALLGATPHFLEEVDGDAYAGKPSVEKLAQMLSVLSPVAVFTHWPVDGHPDHVQTAAVVSHAVRKAGWNGEGYFFEVLRSQTRNFHPLYSVDVTKTIDRKTAMLRKYVCQNPEDSLAKEKREQAAARGKEREPACAFAEVFTTFDGEPIKGGVLARLPETAICK